MKIRYKLIQIMLLVVLCSISIAQGLDLIFKFGIDHHLFHLFWLIVSFCLGLFVYKNWIVD